MKLPKKFLRLRDIERVTRVVPLIRDLLPDRGNSAESSLLNIIKQKDDALYVKKNEIEILKKKIRELEETITITSDELREAIVQLNQAGGS